MGLRRGEDNIASPSSDLQPKYFNNLDIELPVDGTEMSMVDVSMPSPSDGTCDS